MAALLTGSYPNARSPSTPRSDHAPAFAPHSPGDTTAATRLPALSPFQPSKSLIPSGSISLRSISLCSGVGLTTSASNLLATPRQIISAGPVSIISLCGSAHTTVCAPALRHRRVNSRGLHRRSNIAPPRSKRTYLSQLDVVGPASALKNPKSYLILSQALARTPHSFRAETACPQLIFAPKCCQLIPCDLKSSLLDKDHVRCRVPDVHHSPIDHTRQPRHDLDPPRHHTRHAHRALDPPFRALLPHYAARSSRAVPLPSATSSRPSHSPPATPRRSASHCRSAPPHAAIGIEQPQTTSRPCARRSRNSSPIRADPRYCIAHSFRARAE